MLYPQPQPEREYRETRWKNENSFPQIVTLVIDGQSRRIVWQPGEEKGLDSIYDNAIHTVSGAEVMPDGSKRGGAIVGGLAPRLTKVSVAAEDRAVLHESLDSDLLARRQAEADAIIAKKDADLAAANATLAQAKAEKAKAPAEQPAKAK